jgi:hypothetical protein
VRLDDVPREVLAALAAMGAVFAVVVVLRRWMRRLSLRRRMRRASEAEREAADLLVGAGYAIEATQATARYVVQVDDAPVEITVRVDYIVSRRRRRYVAEVKSGSLAPRVHTAATRRQLLEYRHVFDVDGVLLVDAETRRVHHVELGGRERGSHGGWIWAVAFAAAVVALLATR